MGNKDRNRSDRLFRRYGPVSELVKHRRRGLFYSIGLRRRSLRRPALSISLHFNTTDYYGVEQLKAKIRERGPHPVGLEVSRSNGQSRHYITAVYVRPGDRTTSTVIRQMLRGMERLLIEVGIAERPPEGLSQYS